MDWIAEAGPLFRGTGVYEQPKVTKQIQAASWNRRLNVPLDSDERAERINAAKAAEYHKERASNGAVDG